MVTRMQQILKAAKAKQQKINQKNFKEFSKLFENNEKFSNSLEKVMEIKK